MIFDYRQRIFPNKKLPYQGQKPCRKKSWILNTLPFGPQHAVDEENQDKATERSRHSCHPYQDGDTR